MTDYIAMPEALLHHIPDGVPYDIAALCEPLAVAVHEVTERATIECSDFVVITGAGPIGILAAFVAKACGAYRVVITGMDKSEAVRLPIARELGADVTINVQKEDAVQRVMDLTNGKGADLVIETSGSEAAISQTVDMAKTCGRICAIGLGSKDYAGLKWNSAMFKALNLYFNFSSSYSSWEKALKLMAATHCDLSKIITHRASIEQWEPVFQAIQDETAIKGMFFPE
jgi:L-iditol 2-dehydrogenase